MAFTPEQEKAIIEALQRLDNASDDQEVRLALSIRVIYDLLDALEIRVTELERKSGA